MGRKRGFLQGAAYHHFRCTSEIDLKINADNQDSTIRFVINQTDLVSVDKDLNECEDEESPGCSMGCISQNRTEIEFLRLDNTNDLLIRKQYNKPDLHGEIEVSQNIDTIIQSNNLKISGCGITYSLEL